MKNPSHRTLGLLFIGSVILTLTTVVQAQSSWIGASGAQWTNNASWNPGTGYPNSSGAIVVFTNAAAGTVNISNQNVTVGSMLISNVNVYTISSNAASGSLLTFQTSSGNASLINYLGSPIFNVPISLQSSLDISNMTPGTSITLPGFSGSISGPGSLNIYGTGSVIITGTNNTWSGGTLVSAGDVTLTVNALSIASPLSIAPNGLPSNGNITNNAWMNYNAPGILGGVLSGTGTNNFFSSPLLNGANGVTAYGPGGPVVLTMTNANTYTGPTIVNYQLLSLSNSLGAIASSSGVTLNDAVLVLDNRGAANTLRVGATAPITMNSGALFLEGGSATNGTITVVAGSSEIGTLPNASSVRNGSVPFLAASGLDSNGVLVINSLVRNTGTQVAFSGTNIFQTALPVSNGIIPFATYSGVNGPYMDFATLSNVVSGTTTNYQVIRMAGYATGFNNVTNNTKLTATTNLGTSATINSLSLNQLSLALSNGVNLTLTGGALIGGAVGAPGNLISNVSGSSTITLGSSENFIYANNGGNAFFKIYSGLAGTGTVTFAGTAQAGTTLFGSNTFKGNLIVAPDYGGNNVALELGGGGWMGNISTASVNDAQFKIDAGSTLVADYMVATNGPASYVAFGGNVTLLHGGVFTNGSGGNAAAISVVGVSGTNAILSLLGGTTVVERTSGSVSANNFATLLVSGPGTLLTNATGVTYSPQAVNQSLLVVSNGAKAWFAGVTLGGGAVAAANANMGLKVTGANSILVDNGAYNYANTEGSNNTTTVSQGGNLTSLGGFLMGNPHASTNNTILVTDPGSTLTNVGAFTVSGMGDQLIVSNQALLYNNGALTIQGGNNVFGGATGTVTGAGTTLIVTNGLLNLTTQQNTLNIGQGASVQALGTAGGVRIGGNTNTLVVSDSGTVLNGSVGGVIIGSAGVGNQLVLSNGAKIYSAGTDAVGGNYTGQGQNLATITGAGTVWTNTAFLTGYGPNGNNQTTISAGGQLAVGSSGSTIGYDGSNNTLTVTDPGSIWSNAASIAIAQQTAGQNNQLIVSNSGVVVVNTSLGGSANSLTIGAIGTASSNSVTVTGPGSFLQVLAGSGATLSSGGSNNYMVVNNGGIVEANTLKFSSVGAYATNYGGTYQFTTATPTITSTNYVTGINTNIVLTTTNLVTNTVSSIVVNNGIISFRGVANANVFGNVATNTVGNLLTNITFLGNNAFQLNGSSNTANAVSYTFGTGFGATNYSALNMINGTTLWQSTNLNVGGGGSMLVSNTTATIRGELANAGTIEITGSTATFQGSLANNGFFGIQADNSQVTIQSNVANNSYLTLNNSATTVQGYLDTENALAVNGGSLTVQGALTNGAYMTVAGGTWTNQGSVNNQGVITVVGNAVIQGTVTNANGAALSVTGGSLLVQGNDVNNQGSIQVNNSAALFLSPLTIGGSYISDPSTNTFGSNVTVSASGFMTGTPGDVFNFQQSLFIHATNNTAFDLSTSTVEFSGGGVHTNAITGQDVGANAFGQNFEYGRLTLASTNDLLQFTQGGTSVSNALYVQTLDLGAFVGDYTSVSNMVASLLYAPSSINVYYLAPINGYLNSLRYPLESFPGGGPGGFLIPAIPEPSTMLLWVMGAGCIAWLRRRRS